MLLARWSAAAFVAAYVLVSFSATPTPMMGLWRPLLVGIVAAIAFQLGLWLILRNGDRAAIAASLVALLLGAAWVPLAVFAVAVTWLVAIQVRRRRRGEPTLGFGATMVARNVAIFAWAFAAASAIPVVGWAITSGHGTVAVAEGGGGRPDVVVLLVDAYPRTDSLAEQFGLDNHGFEDDLTSRGFRVAAHSRSNYTATWASLSSMFYGRYVDDIQVLNPPPTNPAEQYRRVMLALATAPVLDAFRREGYEIVTVPSPFESAALTGADRILAPPEWSSFELSLIQHSLIGHVAFSIAPQVALDQHRGRLESTLRLLGDEMARTSSSPRFVFAHLLAPHAPVAYRADGSPAPAPACFPDCNIYSLTSAVDWEGFPGQIEHVNEMVLQVLDRIIADDPEAVVIVMSDHGSAQTRANLAWAFQNFFAARAPGNEVEYEDDVTPLTVLARLTDAPFTSADPFRGWVSKPLEPLTLTPYTGPDP